MGDNDMKTISELQYAISNFQFKGEIVACKPYGNGHINDTILIESVTGDTKNHRYIIQAVNTNIFKEPKQVMENIQKVSEYLKINAQDNRSVMQLIPTHTGPSYYIDENNIFWRAYEFIEDSICLEFPESSEDFYQCAFAFGKFQKDLNDFPADSLYETIPDFHNTPKRFADFLKAVEEDKFGRAAAVQDEINFIKDREEFYSVLIKNNNENKLPLRVSHNDTKCNNVMLDHVTRKALCVIDLDTIMPGFSVTDFGDSIRFGASTAVEDEPDLSKVKLDIEKFRTYTKGFLDGSGGLLLDSEIMLLPEGSKMMTIECGMRFLGDYLMGDVYFKTSHEGHNLERARTQLKLVKEMENHWDEMKSIVSEYIK